MPIPYPQRHPPARRVCHRGARHSCRFNVMRVSEQSFINSCLFAHHVSRERTTPLGTHLVAGLGSQFASLRLLCSLLFRGFSEFVFIVIHPWLTPLPYQKKLAPPGKARKSRNYGPDLGGKTWKSVKKDEKFHAFPPAAAQGRAAFARTPISRIGAPSSAWP